MPVIISAAKPKVSAKVGCGCMVKLISSASAPISSARTASDINSPALVPTIPAPVSYTHLTLPTNREV